MSSATVFIIALATSDIFFSLSIHPMLIATSFGANVEAMFTRAGLYDSVNLVPKRERIDKVTGAIVYDN